MTRPVHVDSWLSERVVQKKNPLILYQRQTNNSYRAMSKQTSERERNNKIIINLRKSNRMNQIENMSFFFLIRIPNKFYCNKKCSDFVLFTDTSFRSIVRSFPVEICMDAVFKSTSIDWINKTIAIQKNYPLAKGLSRNWKRRRERRAKKKLFISLGEKVSSTYKGRMAIIHD